MKNMKKYTYQLFIAFIATVAMVSCSEEEGTIVGNDPGPVVTIYQYTPGEGYSSDNDTRIRVAANSKTGEAYYLAEKTAEMSSMSEDAYMAHVVSTGTKINEISGESITDLILTGLFGNYTITVVAVGSDKTMTSAATTFTGIEWEYLGIGKFADNWALAGFEYEVTIEKAVGLERYRLVAPYKEGLANDDGEWADWLDGTSGPGHVEFWETSGGQIRFKTYSIGLNYQANAANPVKVYYPADLSSDLSVSNNKKVGDKQYQFAPYYYVDGVGGWNNTGNDGVIVITLP
ncbi:MAG: hypothetical protein LBV32_08695 [Tannerellaceae bacterium]|nr:hypothetical protein [Tannerellaceae bacterium]